MNYLLTMFICSVGVQGTTCLPPITFDILYKDGYDCMVDGYTKGTIKGAESYTATGFSADFENSFEGNTKREKILLYISTLGTKSEAQYFAQSFPTNLTFDDGVNIRQYLITVTQ